MIFFSHVFVSILKKKRREDVEEFEESKLILFKKCRWAGWSVRLWAQLGERGSPLAAVNLQILRNLCKYINPQGFL